jgi:predicted enzyme related to lactoylglutathione lyase
VANYIEVVTSDVAATRGLYESTLGVSFSEPDPDLGRAQVAVLPDGSLLGVRGPLAEHDVPVVRVYFAVTDIAAAVSQAETDGAMLAYGPVEQGARGSFAIVIHSGVQIGYWQAP